MLRRWASAGVAATAFVLSACSVGGGGATALSASDVVDEMNVICRTARRDIAKLDPTDAGYYSDLLTTMNIADQDLGLLKPPKSMKAQVDAFVSTIDDQTAELRVLKRTQGNDPDARSRLADVAARRDALAISIGLDRCVGIGALDATSVQSDQGASTVPPTTPPAAPTTDAPQPSLVLTPPTSPSTIDPTAFVADDAAAVFNAPAGYTWGEVSDLAGTETPIGDPVLGPILSKYLAGVLVNQTTRDQVMVFVTVLTNGGQEPWTPEQVDAFFAFELLDGGVLTKTPRLGLPAKLLVGAVDGFDAAAFYVDGIGVSMLAPQRVGVVNLLEAFAAAQSMGE